MIPGGVLKGHGCSDLSFAIDGRGHQLEADPSRKDGDTFERTIAVAQVILFDQLVIAVALVPFEPAMEDEYPAVLVDERRSAIASFGFELDSDIWVVIHDRYMLAETLRMLGGLDVFGADFHPVPDDVHCPAGDERAQSPGLDLVYHD